MTFDVRNFFNRICKIFKKRKMYRYVVAQVGSSSPSGSIYTMESLIEMVKNDKSLKLDGDKVMQDFKETIGFNGVK